MSPTGSSSHQLCTCAITRSINLTVSLPVKVESNFCTRLVFVLLFSQSLICLLLFPAASEASQIVPVEVFIHEINRSFIRYFSGRNTVNNFFFTFLFIFFIMTNYLILINSTFIHTLFDIFIKLFYNI